jgi:hypothetical protein
MDPTATAATRAPDHPSLQEPQGRREAEAGDVRHPGLNLFRALAGPGSLRDDELRKAIGFQGDREEWKRLLWSLHNEGYVKVRWVGLADPDPVEARITARGLAAIAAWGGEASGARAPSAA